MGANRYAFKTHDMGGRLSWNLRPAVSVHMKDWEAKRQEMQKVCQNCHGPEWYTNFYKQFDASVTVHNTNFAKPATEIMALLRRNGTLIKTPFDEDIEWVYFELWHHEGRRARHGAAMMGPDYVQWHGFYEVAKHFYFKFLPLARKMGAEAAVSDILSRPEHQWIRGTKPDGMRLQEAAIQEWNRVRQDATAKRTSESH